MTTYDVPDSIQIEVDGPIRIVRLNRPDDLNATNRELHSGLAALFPQLDADSNESSDDVLLGPTSKDSLSPQPLVHHNLHLRDKDRVAILLTGHDGLKAM